MKTYWCIQMLALRKARGIVRFWKGWWSDNPSGSRPNFFGRQHLTFDKGGKCDGAKQGIVRFWEGWCGARDYCPFTMVVRRAIFGATIRHCLRATGTVSL